MSVHSLVSARAVDVPPARSAVPSDSSSQRCDWFGPNEPGPGCLAPADRVSKSWPRAWAPDAPGIRSRPQAHSAGFGGIGVLPDPAATRLRGFAQPGWTSAARPHARIAYFFSEFCHRFGRGVSTPTAAADGRGQQSSLRDTHHCRQASAHQPPGFFGASSVKCSPWLNPASRVEFR
jgi:hypothetical protein